MSKMSLQIKISITEQEDSFYVDDCTGNYSSDNKGGYGGSNYKKSDIFESFFMIQGPSDKDYVHSIDVTNSIPNSKDISYQVLPIQVGQNNNGTLESGLYKFKLLHRIKGPNSTMVEKFGYASEVFIKNIECCIDKNVKTLNQNAYKESRQLKIIELSTILDGVKCQIEESLYDQANETIDYLKQQCKCSGCN